MKFIPKNFRSLENFNDRGGLRNGTSYTMILVKASGEASYGRTRGDKDIIKEQFKPEEDLLLLSWSGQYKTDIFHLTKDDLENFYYEKKIDYSQPTWTRPKSA